MKKDFKEIAKKILENGNDVVGIRSLCNDESSQEGAECRESYEWDFENDCSTYSTTGETAGGTCVTLIDTEGVWFDGFDSDDVDLLAENIEVALNTNDVYEGVTAIIVGDKFNTDGIFDQEEMRIVKAKVLVVVE